MDRTTKPTNERVVKVALPVDLITRMDRLLVAGIGGFTTRQELIREALENQLLELSHEDAPPEPAMALMGSRGPAVPAAPYREFQRLDDLVETALPAMSTAWTIDGGCMEAGDEPLLGLHNRDYPSLWALQRMAVHCSDGPSPWEELLGRITEEAWSYGIALRDLEKRRSARGLTALFPVNDQKPAAAERGFRSFAIGSIPRHPTPGKRVSATGPLPSWRVCQLRWEGTVLSAGLTEQGWSMLDAVAGISLNLPHGEDHARAFLDHLRHYAPADHGAYAHTLQTVSDGPDRPQLVQTFTERFGGTAAVAGSLAQGYVARAREWGLIEPKLVDSRYWLTAFGRTVLEEMSSNQRPERTS